MSLHKTGLGEHWDAHPVMQKDTEPKKDWFLALIDFCVVGSLVTILATAFWSHCGP